MSSPIWIWVTAGFMLSPGFFISDIAGPGA